MANHDKKDIRQASTIIAALSTVALVVSFYIASVEKKDVPIFLYAIFGGGILGTENITKVIKSIFRIGNGK